MNAIQIATVCAAIIGVCTFIVRHWRGSELTQSGAVMVGIASAVVMIWFLAACAGSTTTVRGSGFGVSGEVIFARAREVCEPGEAFETCIPKCTAGDGGGGGEAP
jgi:hypothetical protein